MPSLETFLTQLFKRFQELGIDYCILRNYSDLPYSNSGRDIDILVHPICNCKAIAAISAIPNVKITGLTKRANMTAVYVYGIFWGSNYEAIEIDLITACTWKGFEYISSRDIINSSIIKFFDRPYIRTPAPYHEAIISFLGTYLYSGEIKEKYKNDILRIFNCNRQEIFEEFKVIFGKGIAETVIDEVLSGNGKKLKQLRPLIIQKIISYHLRIRPWISLYQFIRHLYTEAILYVKGSGSLIIAFLGPDGAGKTTVLDALIPRLQYTANKLDVIHLKPVLFLKKRTACRGVVTDPHLKQRRSVFTSIIKILLWIVETHFDQILNRPRNFHLTLFDRYYDDILVDPHRYRYGAPLWIVRLARNFIPKPCLYVVLVAPTDIVQQRKNEVMWEETERQLYEYKLLSKDRAGLLINTDDKLENICDSILLRILEIMESRANIKNII